MPQIFVLSGADVGRSFDVRAGDTFGRSPDCIVTLKDPSISRRHARLELTEGAWYVVDEGSRNGIDAGAGRVKRARLGDRQEFRLGEVLLRFREEEPSPRATPERAPAASPPRSWTPEQLSQTTSVPPPIVPAPKSSSEPPGAPESGRGASLPLSAAPPPARPGPPQRPLSRSAGPGHDEIVLEGLDDEGAELAPSAARAAPGPPAGPPRTAGLPGGVPRKPADDLGSGRRDQGRVLQYHKVADVPGLMGAELAQLPLWMRLALYLLALAFAAGLAWLAFRGAMLARGSSGSVPAGVEEPAPAEER